MSVKHTIRTERHTAERHTIGGRSIASIREEFPILSRTAGDGAPLVYLDNAATTQKPNAVIEAVAGYYRHTNANVHRGVHTLAEEATAAFEAARERIRGFINAENTRQIVFTRGTTESINLVASSWGGANIGEGDEIILTEMEHHSNLVPWQMLAAEKGAKLKFIPFDESGELELDALDRLWSDRVKLVSVTWISNVFGTVNDVKRIVRYAHERGVPVLLDGAQAVPHVKTDVRELGCDFLAFSGHKMYGPMGIGVLYGTEALLEAMPPYMGGGEMIRSVWLDRATWNELPWKFEAGTPNVEGAVGLAAAAEYLEALGMDEISGYEAGLTAYALERLGSIPGVSIYGRAPDRGAVVSFVLSTLHPHDTAQFLDSRGIAIRAGHHCAHPLMRKLGIPATARVSFSFYNTMDEIDALHKAIVEAEAFFNGVR